MALPPDSVDKIDLDQFYTLAELEFVVNNKISYQSLWVAVRKGYLKAFRPGGRGRWLVRGRDFITWFWQHPNTMPSGRSWA